MNRDTVVAAMAAGLGLLAVGLIAATIDDRRDPDGGGFGGDGGFIFEDPAAPTGEGVVAFPFLDELLLLLVIVFAVFALAYVAMNFRESLQVLLLILGFLAATLAILHFLPIEPGNVVREAMAPGDTTGFGGSNNGGFGDPDGQVRWWPILALLGVFGLVLIAALVFGTRANPLATGDDPPEQPEGDGARADVTGQIGAAAGRAAARMESTDSYGNEVYRAWAEMTGLLDTPEPDTATPGDFASEAIAAGLEPRDVRDLTRLFEDVRYGARPASEDRETAAIELLRRIEGTYAEGA